ncbi:MAG: transcription elongation factor GreB, partial [Synechococcaceae bacterium WBB_3_034]|nr:transcription elongation factor GreB [Synechococcaceae bacterium WBB_3_034]
MSKAFTSETDPDDDDDDGAGAPALPRGLRNYMTPQGHEALRSELLHLLDEERPKMVEVVHWAASN